MTDYLFYKDLTGWKCIDQNHPLYIYDFINPLPDRKIKQIYNSQCHYIIWYWPHRENGVLNQMLILVSKYNQIPEKVYKHKFIIEVVDIPTSALIKRVSDKPLIMYICKLPEPILQIKYYNLIFITLPTQILVCGNNLQGVNFNLKRIYNSFTKFVFNPADVDDIYLGYERVFVQMGDIIHCSGTNEYGELSIGKHAQHCIVVSQTTKQFSGRHGLINVKLKKIICLPKNTIFWYQEGSKSYIYKAGLSYPSIIDCDMVLTETYYIKIYDIQSYDDTYIVVFAQSIEVVGDFSSFWIKYDSPIQRAHLDVRLYVEVDNQISVYSINKKKATCDTILYDINLSRWFNKLPYAHGHWGILRAIFAGFYICPDSPFSRARMPIDVIKIIVNYLADAYRAGPAH